MSSTTVPPDHFVIVVEENHNYWSIIGNPNAPFINSLAAEGTLFTNSYAITRPSEPNYLALLSGSTQGVTDDGIHLFPTTPTLTITNTSLNVTAGGSVPLGITAKAARRVERREEAIDRLQRWRAATSEPNGQELVYAARVLLDRAQMEIEGRPVQLLSGMAVTVEIKTGSRRIISYLLSPLVRYRQEVLRER